LEHNLTKHFPNQTINNQQQSAGTIATRQRNTSEPTSECSRNYFISEKYNTAQIFKLHFLENNPLVQLYNSASDCKGVGIIPGNHCAKSFSALPLHSL
jgi:hypothetical protein